MSTTIIHRVLVVAVLLSLFATPLSARDINCFRDIAQCFEGTATIASFWYRTWEALDCELGFISCVRIAVFGI